MDWSHVIYAGIGGGLGGGLGALIASLVNNKIVKNSKYHGGIIAGFSAGLAVLGMNYATYMYENMDLPRLDNVTEIAILASSPIYPAMKKHEPEYFNKIIEHIDQAIRKNTPQEDMINSSREILQQMLKEKLQFSDEATLTTTIEIARQNYQDYKNSKPFLCTKLLNQEGLGDVTNLISEASQKLEQQYTLQVIRLPRTQQPAVDKDMAKKSFQQLTDTMAKFMRAGENTRPQETASVETLKRVCDIGIRDMQGILDLPDNERGNYIRNSLAP